MNRILRIATRSSPLALWQARHVAGLLRAKHPGLRIALLPLTSSGDVDRTTPLYGLGTVGIFVKEVQTAVLRGDADLGVHSCKDLPTDSPAGLVLAAVLEREDPRDALIGADAIAGLPAGAEIGTSSLRRRAQLAHLRPDLSFANIRGNVETRLRKVATGEVAATVMAMAGLKRLGLLRQARAVPLDPWRECTPAPGQGAVAIDCRSDDPRTQRLLAAVAHRQTAIAVAVERAVLAGLRGGCSLPLGCYARRIRGEWHLHVRLGSGGEAPDGTLEEFHFTGAAAGLAGRALAALGAAP